MYWRTRLSSIKWRSGRTRDASSHRWSFFSYGSDDEGSDEEEENDDDDNECEEENEDDDDEYQEVDEEISQSPSTSFNAKAHHEKNNDRFGVSTPTSSKTEAVGGLSSMMAKFDFNVTSPFNFGFKAQHEVSNSVRSPTIYTSNSHVDEREQMGTRE